MLTFLTAEGKLTDAQIQLISGHASKKSLERYQHMGLANTIALLGKDNDVRFIDLGNVHSSAATSIIQFIVNELVHIDEIQSGISPNLLVRNWPPAFQEWRTKAVRDAFYASPLLPRLLNPDAIKETIARGVSNGQLAYVGKTAGERYNPFQFERAIVPSDVEISDEMFIITKETAEAYRRKSPKPDATEPVIQETPAGSTAPAVQQDLLGGLTEESRPDEPENRQADALTWSGEIPHQKWMNFYRNILTKFGVSNGLKLTVKVECKPEAGVSPQRVEEIKSALRELGLSDRID